MLFDPNPLFYEMVRLYRLKPADDKITIFNEGGTRSSKTWDFFHFLVLYCDHNRNQGREIYCHRDTLTNCRDYTLKDFVNCLKTIGIFDPGNLTNVAQKPYYNLFGNHVYFRGLDDEKNMEGYPSDIAFFNELLEVDNEKKISGIKMRCRKLLVADWNPKFTSHWAFAYEGRPNTYFTRTTFRNNKHCPQAVVNEILSYEPTHPDDRHLIELLETSLTEEEVREIKSQIRPHPTNVANGTADEFRWRVYGLGKRGAMTGLIFPRVNYIEKFPEIAYTYGMDFGFTSDPTTLVKYAEEGADIYLELLHYAPTPTPEEIIEIFASEGVTKKDVITADSADKYVTNERGTVEMVNALRAADYNVNKVQKIKSVMFWIANMQRKRINIVKNKWVGKAKEEQENYKYKEVNGITINQPEDKFNHFWDGARYAHMAHNTKVNIWG